MKKIILTLLSGLFVMVGFSQSNNFDEVQKKIQHEKDSTLTSMYRADSLKVDNQFKRKQMIAEFKNVATYPVIDAGAFSGVVPVEDITEVPDPNLDYKLLFELTASRTDSISGLNADLVEISRIINLHVASGIPVEKIYPVIVVHASSLNSFTTNEFYNGKFKKDNPNIELIEKLEDLGATYIACGQAMFFFDVPKEALLPVVKVSLTAQTVLSSYQLKGYVKFRMR
ncbi:hypothetical protein [Flagellimonas lutimaris]|uniref:hypothetical protein n=1 Tax=Flagellimonas lutimaris TaxID=475082 RepID=UPI003F5CF79A